MNLNTMIIDISTINHYIVDLIIIYQLANRFQQIYFKNY